MANPKKSNRLSLKPDVANYLKVVRGRFWYLDLQLTGVDDKNQVLETIGSDKLYVNPFFSKSYIDPQVGGVEKRKDLIPLKKMLLEQPRCFILGDPGIGKTSLVHRVSYLLSSGQLPELEAEAGEIIPLPFILRQLPLIQVNNWEDLIGLFCEQRWLQDCGLSVERIKEIAASGRALFLFDGLDEVVNEAQRRKLGAAIETGLNQNPGARAWITSRIVGFDQRTFFGKPFGQKISRIFKKDEERILSEESEFDLTPFLDEDLESIQVQYPEFFVAPFRQQEINRFMNAWLHIHQHAPEERDEILRRFGEGLKANQNIHHLARIPITLGMMALYFQINRHFPDGRVKLYRTISSTLLDKLSRLKGMNYDTDGLTLKQQQICLAAIADHMQKMRGELTQGEDLVVAEAAAKEIMLDALTVDEAIPDNEKVTRVDNFFKKVNKRGSMFIPRGPGLYAFLHLSYQEYFAAERLKDRFETVNGKWSDETEQAAFWEWFHSIKSEQIWRETIEQFFEMLAEEGKAGSAKVNYTFKELYGKTHEEGDMYGEEVIAAVRLLLNELIGSSIKDRFPLLDTFFYRHLSERQGGSSLGVLFTERNMIHRCQRVDKNDNLENVRYVLGATPTDLNRLRNIGSKVTHISFADKKELGAIPDLAGFEQLGYLDFNDSKIVDLAPLAGMDNLQYLRLNSTQVSDLSPLKELSSLSSLDLTSTPVSDLSPLKELSSLSSLDLTSTPVSDLSPLKELSSLSSLRLNSTQVSDLSPLKELSSLSSLYLNSTQVSDLGPLKKLSSLSYLDLNSTPVSDLSPLKELSSLSYLDLTSTQVSDLSPLKKLSSLSSLHLTSTPVSDLSPLKKLSRLSYLYLGSTQVSDLRPLKELSRLDFLSLNSTQVSDLNPLKRLSRLSFLRLSLTQVSDLSPLNELSNLISLHLNSTQVFDLNPLKGLSRLRFLRINSTPVSELKPLKKLSRLRDLYLNSTQVSDLGPLKDLPNLRLLEIKSTKVSDLSPLDGIKNLKIIQ